MNFKGTKHSQGLLFPVSNKKVQLQGFCGKKSNTKDNFLSILLPAGGYQYLGAELGPLHGLVGSAQVGFFATVLYVGKNGPHLGPWPYWISSATAAKFHF